ncbi:hypothetical protein VNO80_04676 [Phaseolus coccineus]|uniref:Chromo domain-containing protein n=1 Tax=Phaseolus coccineus TaxID=3886 RepID=A0AAN9RNG4_PHACN
MVHWKGYRPDADSWEPIEGLRYAKGGVDVICGEPPCQGFLGRYALGRLLKINLSSASGNYGCRSCLNFHSQLMMYCEVVIPLEFEVYFCTKNTIFSIKTHLDHLLNPGDYSLGSYEEKDQKKRGKPSSRKLI